jgi:hypothetical protein
MPLEATGTFPGALRPTAWARGGAFGDDTGGLIDLGPRALLAVRDRCLVLEVLSRRANADKRRRLLQLSA